MILFFRSTMSTKSSDEDPTLTELDQEISESAPSNCITEESLVSQETLDRSSPEIWGDDSLQKFVAKFHPTQPESPTQWLDLSQDDKKEIERLESLNEDELMMMAKGLFDRAYFLEKEELVEMQKGKLLNVFGGQAQERNLTS